MNGKAKEAFEKWFEKEYRTFTTSYAENVDKINNHIIVEWLDSVGIYISTSRIQNDPAHFFFGKWIFVISNEKGVTRDYINQNFCDSRQEATEAAIKKAVEIFNEKYK